MDVSVERVRGSRIEGRGEMVRRGKKESSRSDRESNISEPITDGVSTEKYDTVFRVVSAIVNPHIQKQVSEAYAT